MKFKLIATVLGLSQLNLQAGLFGGKPHAKFDEEQLEKLENSLAENAQEDLKAQIENLTQEKLDLKNENKQLTKNQEAVENALEQALELNEIKAGEDITKSIEALGTQCKEYGSSKNRHTFTPTDGKDKDPSEEKEELIGGFMNPKDEVYQKLGKI